MDDLTFMDVLTFAGYVVAIFGGSFLVAAITGRFIRFGSGE